MLRHRRKLFSSVRIERAELIRPLYLFYCWLFAGFRLDLIIGTSAGFERIIMLLEDFDRIIGSDLRIPGSLTSSCVTGFEKAFRISSAEGISLDGVEPPETFFGSTTRGRSAFADEFTLDLGVAVFEGEGFADGETAGVITGVALAAVAGGADVFTR